MEKTLLDKTYSLEEENDLLYDVEGVVSEDENSEFSAFRDAFWRIKSSGKNATLKVKITWEEHES